MTPIYNPLFEPLTECALRLMTYPGPRHLNELRADPGRTVAADPLVAFAVPAGPRCWRHADPACEPAAVAEATVEDLVDEHCRVVLADPQ